MAHILPFVFLGPTVMTLPLADVPLAPPEPTSPLYSTLCTGSYCDDTPTSRCAPCPPRTYQPPVQYTVYRCIPHSVCFVSPLDHDINDGRTGVLREGNRTQKRRRKAASSRQARPDPEGGSQLEHLMAVPRNTGQENARSPVQDTEDPEGNERDLNTKDATYGLQELTEDGDVTVTTSLREEEEDLYKETPV
ncbi:hypothetical protein Bbelb_400730 [Branchiostoma belcheri]|nr:hypothetical protein Bbelb_400730 [Branchiostoma belcheri]